MRFSPSLLSSLLLVAAGTAQAASSWGFDDGSISVTSKTAGEDGLKEKLSSKAPLETAIVIGGSDTAKITLTAKDGGKAKRPHQAFLLLKDEDTGVEAPFPLEVKENGKGIVKLSQKEIPVQLLTSSKAVRASLVLGSFGSSQGIVAPLFDVTFEADPNAAAPQHDKPLRYGKLPEIHHIFKADARSPPKIISIFFVVAVLASLPVLFGTWLFLGANVNHLPKALGKSPLSHAGFFGSIVAMELVFFMYYSAWNLFQVLPFILAVGVVAVFSGSKALGEVQGRRLAGER